MLRLSRIALLASCLGLAASPAYAVDSLTDETVHAYFFYPDPGAVLYDLGVFSVPGGGQVSELNYQLTANQVIFTANQGDVNWPLASFAGLGFVFENGLPAGIQGLTLNGASTASGASQSDASISDDALLFNFAGQSWAMGQTAIFDIQFAPGLDNGVPEPGTWSLMLLGFGAAGYSLRRQRKASAATA